MGKKSRNRNLVGLRALGEALQEKRRIKGYSQEEFAEIVGAHADTVGKWERGGALPAREFWPTIIRDLKFDQQDFDNLLKGCVRPGDEKDTSRREPETHAGVSPKGFVRVTDGEPVPQSRQRQAARLRQIIAPAGTVVPSFIVIEGRTGVGKTHLVGQWFRDHGRALFGSNAVCVDCSTKLIDQVRPTVEEHLSSVGAAFNGETLSERMNSVGNYLVVIDGLRLSRSGEILAAQAPHKSFQIRDLVEIVSPFFEGAKHFCLIVCIENNYRQMRFRGLRGDVEFKQEVVGPLDEQEGAKLLEDLGANLDVHDLREISRRLHGLPIALSASALEMSGMTGVELERYADNLLPRVQPTSVGEGEGEFDRFFRNWLSRSKYLLVPHKIGVESRPEQIDPHPHALLRLLALMPGPVSRQHLEQIVGERRIRRLTDLSVQEVLRQEVPFVAVVDDHIDLHTAVRRLLRAELDAFILQDKYDEFTAREELEWIHWKCALLHWRSFASEGVVDSQIVAATEAFVYHMMEQIRLIPKDTEVRRRKRPRRALGELQSATLKEYGTHSGQFNDVQLWLMAYDGAVRPFLLDRGHTATKIHGQYETKARILTYLTAAVDDYNIAVHQFIMASLYKELSLSWMHAGRLKLAQDALSRATSLVLTDDKRASLAQIGNASSSIEKDLWRLECDLRSLSVTLSMRQGRTLDDCSADLEAYYDTADGIITNLPVEAEPLKWTPALEAGALRILVRKADIALGAGDYGQTLSLFDRADRIRKRVRGGSLDGEAARRYVLTLVRCRSDDEKYLQRAIMLVEQNILELTSRAQDVSKQVSSDVIPFLTLRAGINRVLGDLDLAAKAIKSIQLHEYVRRRECTFSALVELEMEEIRQDIAAHGANEVTFGKAEALARRLGNAHHWTLHYEANLLAVEACETERRKKLLTEAKLYFRQIQYRLRLADIVELEAGRSAIRTFGL